MLKIEEVAEKGNNLETLKALRQNIARAIDSSSSGRDISSLSRQLQLVLDRIAELEAQIAELKSSQEESERLIQELKEAGERAGDPFGDTKYQVKLLKEKALEAQKLLNERTAASNTEE